MVSYVAGTVCFFFVYICFVEGKTFAVKTYSVLINIIRYAGVTIFHPDTNDFGFFFISDVGKKLLEHYKSYCGTIHFRRITSIYQPTNAHIISHKTILRHFKTLRHVSILSDHHQGALFLAKVILQYSQFNSYLQTRCCGSISCCVVEQWLGVRRTTHT